MYRYVIKRILAMIPILLCASFIVFGIMALSKGNPARIILGEAATQEAVDKLAEEMGLNDPFLVRYWNYLKNIILHFDFGTSYRTGQPVMNEIISRAPVSIRLAIFGVIFAAIVGIPLGVISAVKQYSAWDTIPRILALFLGSMPSFWLGMLLIYYLSYKLDLFPPFGIDTWKHYVLPVFANGLIYAAQQLRYTRSSMLETIRSDYVRTARAKGAEEKDVIWKHALKNALLPTITSLGSCFSALLGGTVVLENLFNIPGLGSLIKIGIDNRDTPQVMAATLVLATLYSIVLLVVDLLYAAIDPRVKAKYTK